MAVWYASDIICTHVLSLELGRSRLTCLTAMTQVGLLLSDRLPSLALVKELRALVEFKHKKRLK